MLFVPTPGVIRVDDMTGAVGTATIGVTTTTAGTSTAKGTPTELFASTAFDSYWMVVLAMNYGNAATASEGCMDILIGAATEEVLIPNLLMGGCHNRRGRVWEFPLYVPAGSRLAVQAAGVRVSTGLNVAVWLFGGNGMPGYQVGTKVVTYGMGTVPNGVAITPGASGAEGSFTQITAATSEDHICLLPSFQPAVDTNMLSRNLQVDIGLGAATEEELGGRWWFTTDSDETTGGPYPSRPFYQRIPSGTRLALRASCEGTLDSNYNAVIHGVS